MDRKMDRNRGTGSWVNTNWWHRLEWQGNPGTTLKHDVEVISSIIKGEGEGLIRPAWFRGQETEATWEAEASVCSCAPRFFSSSRLSSCITDAARIYPWPLPLPYIRAYVDSLWPVQEPTMHWFILRKVLESWLCLLHYKLSIKMIFFFKGITRILPQTCLSKRIRFPQFMSCVFHSRHYKMGSCWPRKHAVIRADVVQRLHISQNSSETMRWGFIIGRLMSPCNTHPFESPTDWSVYGGV